MDCLTSVLAEDESTKATFCGCYHLMLIIFDPGVSRPGIVIMYEISIWNYFKSVLSKLR